jgi:hypothetical protein
MSHPPGGQGRSTAPAGPELGSLVALSGGPICPDPRSRIGFDRPFFTAEEVLARPGGPAPAHRDRRPDWVRSSPPVKPHDVIS